MDDEPRSRSWWATLPGILTAIAGVVTAVTGLIVAVNQAGVLSAHTKQSAQAQYGTTTPAMATGSPARSAAAPAATTSPSAGLPATHSPTVLVPDEVRAGPVAYKFLAAHLDPYAEGKRALRFAIRFTNTGARSGVAIGPDFFRLTVDGVPLAPERSFIGVVDFQSAKEGDVLFIIPEAASNLVLQVGDVGGQERTKISIDLKATRG